MVVKLHFHVAYMQLSTLQRRVLPILHRHAVQRAGLFGSRVRGTAREGSDVDILVELSPGKTLLDFVQLKLDLEDQLGISVDVVEYAGLKTALRDKILAEEVRLYG